MDKIIFLFFFLMLISLSSGCRAFTKPEMPLDQMFEDYDFMTSVLRETMPHIAVIREYYGIDVEKKLAEYRAQIPEAEDAEDFAVLVASALFACKGHHLGLTVLPPDTDTAFLESIYGEKDTKQAAAVNALLVKHARQHLQKGIPFPQLLFFTYYDGDYYIPCPFSVNGRRFPGGMKLLSVDGHAPQELEFTAADHLNYYDFRRKRFYGGDFYRWTPPEKHGERTFAFLAPDNCRITVRVRDHDRIAYGINLKPYWKLPKFILYLSECQTIYIRIPAMNLQDLDFYLTETEKIQRKYHPRFAIIDIRNNGGGSDILGLLLVNALLRDPVLRGVSAFPATERMKLELIRRGYILEQWEEKSVDFLGGKKFLVSRKVSPALPSTDCELKVEHLYILTENVYSAAGTLSSRIAFDNAHVTSIGMSNPRLLGKGVNPFIFSLPNSRLTIQLEPALDITNCRTAAECAHIGVEVELNLAPAEYLKYLMTPVEPADVKQYLLYQDPFAAEAFRKIRSKIQAMSK